MTVIQGAYKAIPSPDGQLVAYGNGETFVRFPDGRTERISDGAPSGWHGRDVAVSRYLPNGRQLVWVNVDTGQETYSSITVEQAAGYFPQVACIDGHVVSSANGVHYLDGKLMPTELGAGVIEAFDGEHILYAVQAANGAYTTVVRSLSGIDLHRIPGLLQNARLDRVEGQTYLSATGPTIWAPDGTRYDGPSGEACGPVTSRFGQIIAITGLVEANGSMNPADWTTAWLARPLAEWHRDTPFWKIERIGLQHAVVVNDTAYGSDGQTGLLTFAPLPYDQDRQTFPVDVPTPNSEPAPQPEPIPAPTVPPVSETPQRIKELEAQLAERDAAIMKLTNDMLGQQVREKNHAKRIAELSDALTQSDAKVSQLQKDLDAERKENADAKALKQLLKRVMGRAAL